ncbi:tetratricopeptide repeat protein [Solimonas aquatica]|nr:tetratricopeptide repeat protein [Solimonas aquatica]
MPSNARIAAALRSSPLLLCALVLAACQSMSGTHQVYPTVPEPVIQPLPPPPPPATPRVLPAPSPVSGPRSAEDISGGAVSSLMKQARAYMGAKQPDRAAGVLERALRIEPRNYFVWSALGQAYLGQQNYAQAESMAAKSNALSHGNLYVSLENWKTIAAARQASGDKAGAQEAQATADAIQARLSAAAGG